MILNLYLPLTKRATSRRATEREHLTKGRGFEIMNKKRTPPCWTALDENDHPVQIEYAKRKVKYFCPDCKKPMIPKMGEIVSHHFAHKPADDGSEAGCGGEGYRHFRVKTFLKNMLKSIKSYKFAYDIEIRMEKAYGNDVPDISVVISNVNSDTDELEVLAIEIIDTHPPSEEKRTRWKDNMLEITITDWKDEVIGNASSLSGELFPYLTSFDKFVETIKLEQSKTKFAEERLIKERTRIVDELLNEHESEYQRIKNSKDAIITENLVRDTFPNVWFATYTVIKDVEMIYVPYRGYVEEVKKKRYGVNILTDYDDDEPQAGDWVWIKLRKGTFKYQQIGARYDESQWYDSKDKLIFSFKHHTIGKAKYPPELSDLMKNYRLMK